MNILGVRIDEVRRPEAQKKAREFLRDGKQHTIFTPNPEMLVDAQPDEEFRHILNSGSLNICDGKGIQFVSRGKLKRIPGIDFMLDICRIAEQEGKSVYLLGSMDKGLLEKTAERLKKEFKELRIVGCDIGVELKNCRIIELKRQMAGDIFQEYNETTISNIVSKSPDVLFVGFGHGKQEWWIDQYLRELSSVKIAMGVGGAFDILGGKLKRAPRLFRYFGLEWVWRLLQEPRRFPRIVKATAMFLWFAIKNRAGVTN